MNKNTYIIRYVTYSDLDEIAKIHKESYPKDHFLNEFNLFLIKKYYKSFLKYPILFLVCIKYEKICGFILGLEYDISHKAKSDFIKENKYILVAYVISRVFSKKFILKFFPRLINLVKSLFFNSLKQKETTISLKKSFHLLSIAISNEEKGKGIANILLDNFEKILKKDSIKKYFLSVNKSNFRAIKFYKKNNFYVEKENKASIEMCKILS
jgi:ribosomal protein S18 acetylase RimI-like enzyme